MTTYNVLLPIVELIEAENATQAIQTLTARVKAAGFEIYEGGPIDAFESEPIEETAS